MNSRYLITKGLDTTSSVATNVNVGGLSILIDPAEVKKDLQAIEEQVEFTTDPKVKFQKSIEFGKEMLKDECPIGSILIKGDDVLPLSQLYDYSVKEGSNFSKVLPIGAKFEHIFENPDMQNYMRNVCVNMFPNINPQTGEPDIDEDAYFTPYIPLAVLTGVVTSQQDDAGNTYFNPEGTVSVAEFLDGLNAIKYGANSNINRRKSLDNVSTVDDYFNEGYISCLRGISSPFFNLYTREELLQPITRIEMAYITVICWERFIDKFNNLYGGAYNLGVSFDWDDAYSIVYKFVDGLSYKVSKLVSQDEFHTLSLNIKDYKGENSMTAYKQRLKDGVSAIPLPMFMSMVELGNLQLFNYDDMRLDPLRQVSRGELCFFLSKLAKEFPTKYSK